jgi:hypothetical protein
MAAPVWKTPAGKIDTIEERQLYSFQLIAEDADSTALTYSKIAGNLPPGIELTTSGELRGVPFEVATRSLYSFVVRVTDGTNIADRTFNIQVQGADAPRFVTASGALDMSDSTRAQTEWVLDGSYIEFQMQAIDDDTAVGQTLVYDIVSGSLPPGVSMSSTGLISGIVKLTDDERYGPIGGYDNIYPYDDTATGYDPTVRSISRSQNFEFTVRVTDGASYATQINSIFVFTADFWRIDNNRILVDMTQYQGYPLLMSNSANRRPIFTTDADLGTFRHNNEVVIKIDVENFDPLQGDLEYVLVSGTLPPGLTVDLTSGEVYGRLGSQSAIELEYRFTIRAQRTTAAGTTVYTDREFILTTIGDIDIGIDFVTASNLGTIQPGIPCLFSVEAKTPDAVLNPDEVSNRVFSYSIISGSLPPGLTLSPSGNIVGQVDKSEFTIIDDNNLKLDNSGTTFDKKFTFKVGVSDQYQNLATSKEFNITVSLPYNKEYGSVSVGGLLSNIQNSVSDINLYYTIAQDPNINNEDNIFRSEDPAFGLPQRPEMLLVAGLEHQTVNTLQEAMILNHTPKTLYFGDVKTAVAKENGVVKYEVVYVEMKDNLVNQKGNTVSNVITLRTDINQPMLGTRADDKFLTTDYTIYNVTTNQGFSFNLAGSKLRYANLLTADFGYFEKLFPNAVNHMRENMRDLGQKEYVHLPLWMRTSQDDTGTPIGYTPAVVLAYCKPGKSGLVRGRILRKGIDFKKILFKFDRYTTTINQIDADTFTSDGSTKTYTLNEIVHEEEIKVRDNAHTMRYGEQVTADNNVRPSYLSADTILRSSDYEPEFYLTHNESDKTTTINFTNAPQTTSKIRVERKGDKYLAFKRKLKE